MLVLLMTVAGQGPVAAQEHGTSSSFVPGEVVVKFLPSTRIAESVELKPGASEPAEQVLEYVQSVSADMGIPLQVKRLGSGGSIVLTINQSELLERWSKKLRAKENISLIEPQPPEGSPRSSEPSLLVGFAKASPEEKILSQAVLNGTDADSAVRPIVESLRKELNAPLVANVEPPGRLQIKPDIKALTLYVVERLKRKAEIEYAQPNFIRGRMGTSG